MVIQAEYIPSCAGEFEQYATINFVLVNKYFGLEVTLGSAYTFTIPRQWMSNNAYV